MAAVTMTPKQRWKHAWGLARRYLDELHENDDRVMFRAAARCREWQRQRDRYDPRNTALRRVNSRLDRLLDIISDKLDSDIDARIKETNDG